MNEPINVPPVVTQEPPRGMKHRRENNILTKLMDPQFYEATMANNGFVAGGAVRSVFASEAIRDFDIFFRRAEDYKNFMESFDISDTTFSMTDTAATHKAEDGYCYQAICAVYGEPAEIIKNFDFTCCMGAWVPETAFVLHDDFFQHCSQHRLVFNANAQYPICSLWRALKFIKRGWKLSAIESIKMALCINHLALNDRRELKRQLLGIDTLFLKEFTDSLEKDGERKYDYLEAINYLETFFNDNEESI